MGQEYYRRELDLKHISGNSFLKYELESTNYKVESASGRGWGGDEMISFCKYELFPLMVGK